MSLRLEVAEPAPEGIRRIVCEQIDGAMQELGDRRRNQHKAIHSARQRCKRIRAVLRLTRSDLNKHYGAENRRFRDIARRLSDVRDAEAVLEALDKLGSHSKNTRKTDALRAARRILLAKHRQAATGEEALAARMSEVVETLREAREQVAHWPLASAGFELLGPGAQKTYADGRNAYEAAYRDPTDARFHETRKRVKYLWYQMRVLNNVWPDAMRAYRRSLHNLSELLGDDHDLTVLRAMLVERAAEFRGAFQLDDMLGLIDARQIGLRMDAQRLGARVFAERPRAFRKRLECYWRAWQSETDATVVQPPASGIDTREVA